MRTWPPSAADGGFTVCKGNFVDHTITDQTSILRFIEDNWLGGQRIGHGSFDQIANSLDGMFDFKGKRDDPALILDDVTGQPKL